MQKLLSLFDAFSCSMFDFQCSIFDYVIFILLFCVLNLHRLKITKSVNNHGRNFIFCEAHIILGRVLLLYFHTRTQAPLCAERRSCVQMCLILFYNNINFLSNTKGYSTFQLMTNLQMIQKYTY